MGLEASFSPEVESKGLQFLLADAHRYADELVSLDWSDVEVADAAPVEEVGLRGVRKGNCRDVAGAYEAVVASAHLGVGVAA